MDAETLTNSGTRHATDPSTCRIICCSTTKGAIALPHWVANPIGLRSLANVCRGSTSAWAYMRRLAPTKVHADALARAILSDAPACTFFAGAGQ